MVTVVGEEPPIVDGTLTTTADVDKYPCKNCKHYSLNEVKTECLNCYKDLDPNGRGHFTPTVEVGSIVEITGKVIEIDGETVVINTKNDNDYCVDIHDAVVR